MRLPGFTAEAVLYTAGERYRTDGSCAKDARAISPTVRPAGLDKECYRDCYDANFQDCVEMCLKKGG